MKTYLQDESAAYTPRGSQIRKGRAIFPDGKIRAVRAGIPDTFFSIPAHAHIKGKYVRGFLTLDDVGEIHFNLFNTAKVAQS